MWPDDYGLPNHFLVFGGQSSLSSWVWSNEAAYFWLSPNNSKTFWCWICSITVLPTHKYFFLCSYQLGLCIEEFGSGSGRSMFNGFYIHLMPLSASVCSYCNCKLTLWKRSVLYSEGHKHFCLLLLSRYKCGNFVKCYIVQFSSISVLNSNCTDSVRGIEVG